MSTGRVVAIDQTVAGVTVDGDHAENDDVISVMDCVDLEEGGGLLSLPSGAVVEYGPVDLQGTSVTLVEELPEDVEDSERLATFPPQVTTVAAVVIDEEGHAEPVPVEVPSGIAGWSSLAPGAMLTFRVTSNGTLLATNVTAGTLSVAADQVSAGTIRSEWRMSRDGAIVVGDDEVGSGEFTYDGLRFSTPGPMGPYENVVMTTTETSFGVLGPDGTLVGGISEVGAVTGSNGSFSGDVSVKGTPLVGQLGNGITPGWLDRLPRGVIARDERMTPSSTIVPTDFQIAHMSVSAYLLPGRQYRICGSLRARLHTSNAALSLFLRHREGFDKPTTSDPQIGHIAYGTGVSNSAHHRLVGYAEAFYTVDSPRMESFLLCYRGDYGGTPQRDSSYLYVEDVGPVITAAGGSDEEDDNKVTFTTTWQATDSRMYTQTGALVPNSTGRIDAWYWNASPIDRQMPAWIYGGTSIESTDDAQLGVTIGSAVSGAVVSKAEIYIRNKVFLAGATSGNVAFSQLGSATLPSTRVIDGANPPGVFTLTSGQGLWVEVPPSWFSGSNRGVCMGDKDGTYMGWGMNSAAFHGINDTDPPLLRLTYTREED